MGDISFDGGGGFKEKTVSEGGTLPPPPLNMGNPDIQHIISVNIHP